MEPTRIYSNYISNSFFDPKLNAVIGKPQKVIGENSDAMYHELGHALTKNTLANKLRPYTDNLLFPLVSAGITGALAHYLPEHKGKIYGGGTLFNLLSTLPVVLSEQQATDKGSELAGKLLNLPNYYIETELGKKVLAPAIGLSLGEYIKSKI